MESYENEVRDILENLYSESDYIDYKIEPYNFKGSSFNKDKKRELLKDIVAMANVKSAPADYRFIIVGVSD